MGAPARLRHASGMRDPHLRPDGPDAIRADDYGQVQAIE